MRAPDTRLANKIGNQVANNSATSSFLRHRTCDYPCWKSRRIGWGVRSEFSAFVLSITAVTPQPPAGLQLGCQAKAQCPSNRKRSRKSRAAHSILASSCRLCWPGLRRVKRTPYVSPQRCSNASACESMILGSLRDGLNRRMLRCKNTTKSMTTRSIPQTGLFSGYPYTPRFVPELPASRGQAVK
jgi:hypothetical protein